MKKIYIYVHISISSGKRCVKSSMIGGMKETQEMMEVCGNLNVTCNIELVKPDQINEAMDRLARNDVRYRFVIDFSDGQQEFSKQALKDQ